MTTELPRPVVPKRVRKPEWFKGLLVAANVKRDRHTGEPIFGEVNDAFVLRAWKERLCQLCGTKIAKRDTLVFPGGPQDFTYQEAPLHVECMRYSMLVCPNILRKRDTFTLFVCKSYDIEYEYGYPSHVRPNGMPSKQSNLYWSLWMAHSWGENGFTCGHKFLPRLSFDEFLQWSGR